jgi:hypothetical protein
MSSDVIPIRMEEVFCRYCAQAVCIDRAGGSAINCVNPGNDQRAGSARVVAVKLTAVEALARAPAFALPSPAS